MAALAASLPSTTGGKKRPAPASLPAAGRFTEAGFSKRLKALEPATPAPPPPSASTPQPSVTATPPVTGPQAPNDPDSMHSINQTRSFTYGPNSRRKGKDSGKLIAGRKKEKTGDEEIFNAKAGAPTTPGNILVVDEDLYSSQALLTGYLGFDNAREMRQCLYYDGEASEILKTWHNYGAGNWNAKSSFKANAALVKPRAINTQDIWAYLNEARRQDDETPYWFYPNSPLNWPRGLGRGFEKDKERVTLGWLVTMVHLLHKVPRLAVDKAHGVEAEATESPPWSLHYIGYVYIYVCLRNGDDKSLAPPPDVQIRLEWDNSSTKWNMSFVSQGKSAKVHGLTVHREPAEFEATGTDFCAIVKKNRRVTMPPAQQDMSFKMGLPKAHVEVVFSYDSYQRELDAVNKFCTSEHPPAVNLRHLLMNGGKSNPLPAADRLTDLRRLPTLKKGDTNAEIDAKFSEALEDCKARLKNPTQVKVIEQLTNIKDSTLAVIGPPGTGKTTVSSSVLWTLLYLGHKVVIVAASNTAVENFLLAARASKPRWCPDKQFLRMETESIERKLALLGASQELKDQKQISDEELGSITEAVSAALENEAAEIVQWETIIEKLDEYKRDFDQSRAHANFNVKLSRVPHETTLSGRIADMVRADAAKAEAEHAQDVRDDPTAQDRLTAAERNPSSEYVKFQQELAKKKGSLRGQSLLRYIELRQVMEHRVLSETDALFTTLNNAGSLDWEQLGFVPTVSIVDECGQATLPALMIVLSRFTKYLATILVGDWKQLLPTVLSKGQSEVGDVSRVSALELFERFGVEVIVLDKQFRMAPVISRFPAKFIYEGKVSDSAEVEVDTVAREQAREGSSAIYGINGSKGSEYFMIDVPYVEAHTEEGGTSLQNYGNAKAIHDLLKKYKDAGADMSRFVILAFYKAQVALLKSVLTPDAADAMPLYGEISTVDAFQGREGDKVILDTTAAHMLAAFGLDLVDGLEGESVPASAYARATQFLLDWHRINMALTRARYQLVVVGQYLLMITSYKSRPGSDLPNALCRMAQDLKERRLIYTAEDIIDLHPDAIKQRREKGATANAEELKRQRLEHVTLKEKRIHNMDTYKPKIGRQAAPPRVTARRGSKHPVATPAQRASAARARQYESHPRQASSGLQVAPADAPTVTQGDAQDVEMEAPATEEELQDVDVGQAAAAEEELQDVDVGQAAATEEELQDVDVGQPAVTNEGSQDTEMDDPLGMRDMFSEDQ
ncbi:MAG: hypothetical protein Q9218_005155 [Villophora microphyllina]